MITNHTQLLNYLAEKHNLTRYCEVGVQFPEKNFDKINCEIKHGVDPELTDVIKGYYQIFGCTSDAFFKETVVKYDLIFIDGLHHADQVKRDFENSLRCLNDGGFIVLHDTLPENEEGTRVPREVRRWWGTTYEFAMTLGSYSDIGFVTLDMDEGCTIVWKMPGKQPIPDIYSNLGLSWWEIYQKIGSVLLNVVKPEVFTDYLP